jgi:hypothetical protein
VNKIVILRIAAADGVLARVNRAHLLLEQHNGRLRGVMGVDGFDMVPSCGNDVGDDGIFVYMYVRGVKGGPRCETRTNRLP